MVIAAMLSSIVISAGSFAWGYFKAGFENTAVIILACGAFWLVSLWRRWRWVSPAALVSAVLLGMIGLWFGFDIGWMFSGAIFALLAWDLTEFRRKLKLMPAREDIKGRTHRHLARISLLAVAGLLTVSLFLSIRRQLALEWTVFVFAVLLLASMQLIPRLRK